MGAKRRPRALAIMVSLTLCAGTVSCAFASGAALAQNPEEQEQNERRDERSALVDDLREEFAATRRPGLPAQLSAPVARALGDAPRHAFVSERLQRQAYENRPLPIGYGQTISQPHIVALMTQLADLSEGERVLEIGTGSGYQAAVLAEVGADVRTIEIVPELGEAAAGRLSRLGYDGVKTRIGDGYFGWPEAAPFDAIVVTAAASHIPPPLTEQLAPGGRMVIPVGPPFVVQQLMLVTKDEDGAVSTRQLLPVQFVPLTRADE